MSPSRNRLAPRAAGAMMHVLGCTLLIAGLASAAEDGRPTGLNCSLAAPPRTAGEEVISGIVVRVYPRAVDMPKGYTGCQIMWMPDGGKWFAISVVAIERGSAVRIWSPDALDRAQRACRFRDGKLERGDPQQCPAPEFLIAKSLAPGCVDRILKAGGHVPADCMYE